MAADLRLRKRSKASDVNPDEQGAPPWWKRTWVRLIALASAGTLIVGLVVDLGGVLSWLKGKDSPAIGLATYQLVDGRPVLTDGAIEVEANPRDIFRDRLRLGVPIAVTNLEDDDLEVARVELRYPADLNVKSAGRAKIDPTARTIVYDYELGTLRSTDDFTPLAPLDEIVVPFDFEVIPEVTVSEDGLPYYWVAVVGAGEYPFEPLLISVTAVIYFADRPSVTAELRWELQPGVEIVPQGSEDLERRPITQQERALFRIPKGHAAQQWTQRVGSPATTVTYRKFRVRSGEIQVIETDGTLRRVILDGDHDGYVDLELMDVDGDGQVDVAGEYPGGRLFVDWWRGGG